MHRKKLRIEFGEHDPADHHAFGKELPQNRHRFSGKSELPSQKERQHPADQKEEKSGEEKLNADHFVINRKNIFPPKTQSIFRVPFVIAHTAPCSLSQA